MYLIWFTLLDLRFVLINPSQKIIIKLSHYWFAWSLVEILSVSKSMTKQLFAKKMVSLVSVKFSPHWFVITGDTSSSSEAFIHATEVIKWMSTLLIEVSHKWRWVCNLLKYMGMCQMKRLLWLPPQTSSRFCVRRDQRGFLPSSGVIINTSEIINKVG